MVAEDESHQERRTVPRSSGTLLIPKV